jgi:hypothetical protein
MFSHAAAAAAVPAFSVNHAFSRHTKAVHAVDSPVFDQRRSRQSITTITENFVVTPIIFVCAQCLLSIKAITSILAPADVTAEGADDRPLAG